MSKAYVNPPDGVNALNPVPNVDSRKQVIYDNPAAALSALPANRRAEGLYLLVRDGGKIKRYHFDGGTADEHFVLDPAYEGGGESNIMENDGSGHVRPKFDKKIKATVIDGLATGDQSIETVNGKHTLKGDEAIPTASKYYGTDSQGQRGYHPLPAPEAGGGGEVEEVPADNEKYVRQDAKWVPLPVKEAPTDGAGYLRVNGGWSIPEIADVNGLASALNGLQSNKLDANDSRVQNLPANTTSALAGKVDTVAGKGLSDENYTSEEKQKIAALDGNLNDKVDKVTGKGLSDQNYTIAEKNKVERVPGDTQAALDNKVDKVTGKGLSTHDYTTLDKGKVEKLPNDTQAQLAEKVDKVLGKGLSTHDYIAADKEKVKSLPNDPGAVLNSKAPKESPLFTGMPRVGSQREVDSLHGSAVLTYSEISKLIGNAIQEYGDDVELPSGVSWNVEPRVQQGKRANEVNVISSVLGSIIELDVNGSIVQFPLNTTLTFNPVEDTNALMKRFDIIVADYTDTANPFFQIIEGTKSTEPSIPAPSGNQILINTRLITTQGASVNLEDLTQLIQDFQTQIDDTYEEFRPVPSLVQEKLQDNSNWDANNNWKSTGEGGELLQQFPGAGAGLADADNPYPPGTTEGDKNYTNNYFIEAGSRVYPSGDNYYYIFTQNNIPIRMLKTTLRFTAQEITNIGNSSWSGGTPTVMPTIEPIIGKEYTNGSYLYKAVPDTTGNPSLIRIPLG